MRLWLGVLGGISLTACIDYGFDHHNDDINDLEDTDTGEWIDQDTDLPEADIEVCNGEDDDLDGEVDEGYSDLDGDGIADCVDDSCVVALEGEQDIAIAEECAGAGGEIADPWNVQTEWQWSADTGFSSDSFITPLVASLTDTNDDGIVDGLDIPNVVVVTFDYPELYDGVLWVIAGDTGEVVWKKEGILPLATPAIADLNGDGLVDIAAHDSDGCLTLLSAEGDTQWTTSQCTSNVILRTTVADLTGDGSAEIITAAGVYDGTTGALKVPLPPTTGILHTTPSIGDIDLDGEQEIVLGNTVYDPEGNVEWRTTLIGYSGHWSAIINADTDPEAEVVMLAAGQLVIFEHDGTVKWSSAAGGDEPSPPCVADFDGDGAVEIAWASDTVLSVVDLDGTELWHTEVNDASGSSGCSGYDVNGDGAYEILYADHTDATLFDGATGAVRFTTAEHGSTTAFEYPVIADVDADGSAEILFISNFWNAGGGSHGLTVLGHAGDGWARSGPTWPVADFAVTNMGQDGALPADIPLYWQDHNVYRARPTVDDFGVDLAVAVTDVCFSGCMDDSMVQVAVQVGNLGGDALPVGVPVTLYALNGAEAVVVATQNIDTEIPGGTRLASLVFELTASEVGADGMLVVVDDDGSGWSATRECDELNNEAVWTDLACP